MDALSLDLSGVGVVFEGLPRQFAAKMTSDWAPFVAVRVVDPVLRLRVAITAPDASGTPFEPHEIEAKIQRGVGEVSLPGGHARLASDGRVRVELHSATRESYFNLVNLALACMALQLPTRGALVLHAACLLVDGRAFALVGSAGAGKSTWAELGLAAGAEAVSDDLLLLEGTEVLGSPFRSRHLSGAARPGRWPLEALLFPRHGGDASLAPASSLLSQARLIANLPFVSTQVEGVPAVKPLLDRLLASVPCRELTFAPDPSFMALLARAGG